MVPLYTPLFFGWTISLKKKKGLKYRMLERTPAKLNLKLVGSRLGWIHIQFSQRMTPIRIDQ
jgi:hypothetical protein